MRIAAFACVLTLAACATTSSRADWSLLEGCWIDGSDLVPKAAMTWRRDPANAGGYIGAWRLDIGGDIDAVDFVLIPVDGGMRACMREPGADRCMPAVFGRQGWRQDDVMVFDVDAADIEFGFAGVAGPFFWGRRGGCA